MEILIESLTKFSVYSIYVYGGLDKGLFNGFIQHRILSYFCCKFNPLTSQLQFLVLLSLTECNSMKPVDFIHKNSYPTIFEGALSESVEKILEFFHFP